MYYRGSLGALLIFDLTSLSSFEHLPQWIEEIRENVQNEIPLLLVGNKSDLIDQRAVSIEEVNDFTKMFNLYYMETSAKTGEGVGDCFSILACLMIGEGVPDKLIAKEIVFGPGNITIQTSIPHQLHELETSSEAEYYAPPVPEPVPVKASEPTPSFEPEPEVQYEAPPVPEPVLVKASEPMPSFEPEPEIHYEAPLVSEPAPIKAPKPMSLFEPKLEEQPKKIKPIFTPPPKPPQSEKFKPKSVPFTSSTPIPASPPEDFQAFESVKPSDVGPPTSAPFVLSEEPDIIKPLQFSSPVEKDSGVIPFSVTPQSKESEKNSIVDYTESMTKKKDKKKLDKQKKKEEKEKIKKEKFKEKEVAKLEKEKKLQEAKEKQEKLIEDMKKVKSDKKVTSELIESVEPLPFGQIQPTSPKKAPSESTSLFQTLAKKTEEPTESTEASFVPFVADKKQESEVSTELRIIPNVEDFESKASVIKPSPSTLDFQAEEIQPKKKDLIICKQCGAILSSDYTFCNKCGYRL